MNNQTTLHPIAIESSGLAKVYWDGDRPLEIFKELSFQIMRGEGVAIFGPSGCGKTTLLNLLSGLDRPTEGTVRVYGSNIHLLSDGALAEFRGKNIGFVFQSYHLLSEFTAIENVLLPARISQRRRNLSGLKDRAASILKRVGLGGRLGHYPSELSGGEQQRVAIARALMNDPGILFCDEPTGNLDRQMGADIIDILKELFIREQKTVIMVTHDERIAKIARRVWDMDALRWVS